MKIDLPIIINDELLNKNDPYWVAAFGSHHAGKIAYDIAKKVYIRTRLAEAQNWKCCWCGIDTTDQRGKKNSATIEHITPRSMGGSNDYENLAMACSNCNSKRGITDAEVFFDRVKNKIEKSDKTRAMVRREKRERKYYKRAEIFAEDDWKEISFLDWIASIRRGISEECVNLLMSKYGI